MVDNHLYLGKSYYKANLIKQSIDAIKTAIKLDPTNTESRLWHGLSSLKIGNIMRAKKELFYLNMNDKIFIY